MPCDYPQGIFAFSKTPCGYPQGTFALLKMPCDYPQGIFVLSNAIFTHVGALGDYRGLLNACPAGPRRGRMCVTEGGAKRHLRIYIPVRGWNLEEVQQCRVVRPHRGRVTDGRGIRGCRSAPPAVKRSGTVPPSSPPGFPRVCIYKLIIRQFQIRQIGLADDGGDGAEVVGLGSGGHPDVGHLGGNVKEVL